jgi:hypothetical protein
MANNLLPLSLSAYHTTLTVPYYAETCLSCIIHHAVVVPKAIGAILACSVIIGIIDIEWYEHDDVVQAEAASCSDGLLSSNRRPFKIIGIAIINSYCCSSSSNKDETATGYCTLQILHPAQSTPISKQHVHH